LILDSSAIIAAIFMESERERVVSAITAVGQAAIGSPTLFETELVLSVRNGSGGRGLAGRFVEEFELVEIAFDGRHREVASAAFLRFGKGRHPAGLNLGDCMSYATAQIAREPLLCIGNDFAKTDLELA
jgi:ribonuclease VapC